ncbi:MAG TPA: hypothetical protein VHP14_19675, partial [Anaerolineales bacterium]|nr:hypothetical protein [Anaerolineales bacterium]
MNLITIIIALFATFLIEAILYEKLGQAAFWLGVVILPIKPHWAFALALPLLLGKYAPGDGYQIHITYPTGV